jgi:hypothetical protein
VRRHERDDQTSFLNVDLEIYSTSALDPLIAAFGRKIMVLYLGRERRQHAAHVELAGSGYRENPDYVISRLVGLIKKLPQAERALWNKAAVRQFNIGVQAQAQPVSYELALKNETVAAIASIGARLVITVYAPQRSGTHAK